VRLATLPLLNLYLFHQVLQSADELDESLLPQWDDNPPYQEPKLADTTKEACFIKNLEDIMFGCCMQQEKES
ncbi:hypothetical protein HYDPIDRAFT_50090, partial [Hydnomerulius pinastri MD-312]